MSGHYDLEGKPITADEWGQLWQNLEGRCIGRSEVGPYLVSTVWIGIDHNFSASGPPIIFETMVFGDDAFGEYQRRYSTKEAALAGHSETVAALEAGELLADA